MTCDFFLCFSPCTGLIITSYAKYPQDESYKIFLSKTLEQYKKYRKNYVIDESTKKFIPGKAHTHHYSYRGNVV